MLLKLNVYTDESLTEISRVCEADGLKIPYRVSMYIIQSLDGIELNDQDDILKFITGNIDKMDKIIKATFKVSEDELDCIDTMELIDTIKALYQWGISKVNSLKNGNNSKNVITPVIR